MKAEEIVITEATKVLKVHRAMLDGSSFDDIQMLNAKITNANLSDLEIEGAQLGGAFIHNIGMPPKGHPMYKAGNEQRPLRFEDCNLHRTTITNCYLAGVVIDDCNVNGSSFNDIQMMDTKITNANLSGLEIEGAQLGGAFIHNIGMPPKGHPMYKEGNEQRPLRFEDCDLHGGTITNCNLAGVVIDDCNVTGMKINGVLVEDLLKEYGKKGE